MFWGRIQRMKTYGLSDNLSQMEQGKISKAACVSLGVGGVCASSQHRNETVLFPHPDMLQHAKTVTFLKFKLYGFMPAEDWPMYLHFNSPPLFKKTQTQFKGVCNHIDHIMQPFYSKYSSKFIYLQSVKRLSNKPTRCLGKETICP